MPPPGDVIINCISIYDVICSGAETSVALRLEIKVPHSHNEQDDSHW